MKRCAWRTLYLLGAALGIPHAAAAADPAAMPESTAAEVSDSADADDMRDPAALAELKRATDFLSSLPRFHIRAVVTYDVIQDDGRSLQFEKNGDIYLQRPDRLFAEVRLDDGRHRQLWYDGATLSLAERSRRVHTQVKAPPTLDGMLDMAEELFRDPMPLADLLYSDLDPLQELPFAADRVGDSLVGDRLCTHLSFRGEAVDWQLWVDQGSAPFIRKLAITYREQPGTPQVVAVLDAWETPESFDEKLFRFAVPADSQWLDVLVPMRRRAEEVRQP
jgi:hypothetical protein